MPGVRQALLSNLGIKITSVILALAVYAHVFARDEREAVVLLPLAVEGLPPGLICRGDVPRDVRVRVRARGLELIKMRAMPPRVVIRLEQAREGLLQRPVTGSDVVLPAESAAIILGLSEPVDLALAIERRISRTLPIAVAVRGQPADGHAQIGPLEARPDTLTVSGPESLVGAIDSLRTEPVDLSGRAVSFTTEAVLILPADLQTRLDRVFVRVSIVGVIRRDFGPIRVGLPPSLRDRLSVEPESARVVLVGPEAVVSRLTPQEVRLRVEVAAAREAEDLAPVRALLPASVRTQVRVIEIDPPAVILVRRTP